MAVPDPPSVCSGPVHVQYRTSQDPTHLRSLGGEAHETNRVFFDQIVDNPDSDANWQWKSATEVFKALDDQYDTLDLSLDASHKFDNLFQKNRPFQNFIAEFNTLATKCGKTSEQKVEALKRKVSDEIGDKLAGLSDPPARDNFATWSKQC